MNNKCGGGITGYLNREILRLSVPAIVSNITVPLLGLSDTAISGHLGSDLFIGAIAVGSMMMNALLWLFGFLRMGTTGMTAQAYGRDYTYGYRLVLSQSLFLSILIGVGMIALNRPIEMLLLHFIAPDTAVLSLASLYFRITVWGTPAVLANMAVLGWFLGMQNTSVPMIISIGINVVNIMLSLLAVFVCGLGFKGIALGTLAANWMGLAVSLYLARRFTIGKPMFAKWSDILRVRNYRRFFSVNTDIFFRSACIMAVSLAMTSFGARQGTLILATNALIMQFFLLFSYFMDGIAFTGEALCGRFAGQRSVIMLKKSVRVLLLWSAGLALAFGIVYFFWWEPISSMLTSEADVVRSVGDYSIWLRLIPPVTVLAFVFDGVYIGLTATRRMLIVTLVAALAFFCIALCKVDSTGISFGSPESNDCLWTAFLVYLGLRGILLALQSRSILSPEYISTLHQE